MEYEETVEGTVEETGVEEVESTNVIEEIKGSDAVGCLILSGVTAVAMVGVKILAKRIVLPSFKKGIRWLDKKLNGDGVEVLSEEETKVEKESAEEVENETETDDDQE